MTREERLALLGPETVARIHQRVDEAPDPSPELVAKLRRIMTNPAGATHPTRPAGAPPAANAA
jgi:hypothetical protein